MPTASAKLKTLNATFATYVPASSAGKRAAARQALKERYLDYSQGWKKPDLNVKALYAQIASDCQTRKAHLPWPLLRKLITAWRNLSA